MNMKSIIQIGLIILAIFFIMKMFKKNKCEKFTQESPQKVSCNCNINEEKIVENFGKKYKTNAKWCGKTRKRANHRGKKKGCYNCKDIRRYNKGKCSTLIHGKDRLKKEYELCKGKNKWQFYYCGDHCKGLDWTDKNFSKYIHNSCNNYIYYSIKDEKWHTWIDKFIPNMEFYLTKFKSLNKYWNTINKLLTKRYKRIAKAMGLTFKSNNNKSYQGFFAKRGTGEAYFNPFNDNFEKANETFFDDDDNEYYRPDIVMYRPFEFDTRPIYTETKSGHDLEIKPSDMIDTSLTKHQCKEFAKHYGDSLANGAQFEEVSVDHLAYGCNINMSPLAVYPDWKSNSQYIKWNNKIHQEGERFRAVLPGKKPPDIDNWINIYDETVYYSVYTNTGCSGDWQLTPSRTGSYYWASFKPEIGQHCVKNKKRKIVSVEMQIINAFEMDDYFDGKDKKDGKGWLFQLDNGKWVREIDLYLPNQGEANDIVKDIKGVNVTHTSVQKEVGALNRHMEKYWLHQNDAAEALLDQRIIYLNKDAKNKIKQMKEDDIKAQIKAEMDAQKARLAAIKAEHDRVKAEYDKAIKEANDKNAFYQFRKAMKNLGVDAFFDSLGAAVRSVKFIDDAITGLEDLAAFVKSQTGCAQCEMIMVVMEPTFKILYKVLVQGGPWMMGFKALLTSIVAGTIGDAIMLALANAGIMSSLSSANGGPEDDLLSILEHGTTEGILCFLRKMGATIAKSKYKQSKFKNSNNGRHLRSLDKKKTQTEAGKLQKRKFNKKDAMQRKKLNRKKPGSVKSELGHTFVQCIVIELARAMVMASTGCQVRCECRFSFLKLVGAVDSACDFEEFGTEKRCSTCETS